MAALFCTQFFQKKMVQNESSGNLPTMSDFPTRQEPGSLAPVEPLTFKTADGKPYERSASVQGRNQPDVGSPCIRMASASSGSAQCIGTGKRGKKTLLHSNN